MLGDFVSSLGTIVILPLQEIIITLSALQKIDHIMAPSITSKLQGIIRDGENHQDL